MLFVNSNILSDSRNKMVSRMNMTVIIPLSSIKGIIQSPCWMHLVLFPPKPTNCAFSERKFFIVDGSIHIILDHIVSITTSNYSVSKDDLILFSHCDFNYTFAYTVVGLDLSKCGCIADLLCWSFHFFTSIYFCVISFSYCSLVLRWIIIHYWNICGTDIELLIPTYCRVPRVGNTDDRQTAAARQTGRTTKHRLSSLLVIYVLRPLGTIQHLLLSLAKWLALRTHAPWPT